MNNTLNILVGKDTFDLVKQHKCNELRVHITSHNAMRIYGRVFDAVCVSCGGESATFDFIETFEEMHSKNRRVNGQFLQGGFSFYRVIIGAETACASIQAESQLDPGYIWRGNVMAALGRSYRKVKASLEFCMDNDGMIELGTALDAFDMFAKDIIAVVAGLTDN